GPSPDDINFIRQLLEIYHSLILQAGGDVEKALQWMKALGQQYGFFNDEFGIDEFRQLLEEVGEAERTPPGGLRLTPPAEPPRRRTPHHAARRTHHPEGLPQRDLQRTEGRRTGTAPDADGRPGR